MHRGWIPLWRKSRDSAVFQDPHLWHLWCWCLMRANHSSTAVAMRTGRGSAVVELGPGQLLFGRKSAGSELVQAPSTTYKRLKRLEKLGNVVIQPGRHWTVVTICEWDTYANIKSGCGQPSGQPRNNQGTTNGQPTVNQVAAKEQPRNTQNNDNNVNNGRIDNVNNERSGGGGGSTHTVREAREEAPDPGTAAAAEDLFSDLGETEDKQANAEAVAAATTHPDVPRRSFADWRVACGAKAFIGREERQEWEALYDMAGWDIMAKAADALGRDGKFFLSQACEWIHARYEVVE